MRLFIAAPFPDDVRDSLCDYMQNMRDSGMMGNFTRYENLHLTLSFLGETASIAPVKQAMDEVKFAPLRLTIGKSGSFGDLLWVGVTGDGLSLLANDLRAGLEKNGVSFDTKKFRPHVTLVRRAVGGTVPEMEKISFTADKISLFNSERIKGRLTYTPLYSVSSAD